MSSEQMSLTEALKRRPAMYLGSKSLTALKNFITGFQVACGMHGIECEDVFVIPKDFHDWVAYRTHFRESTSGWCNMLLAKTGNEEEAFDRFFQLLDEHENRVPQIVAEIRRPNSSVSTRDDEGEDIPLGPPETVRIVIYTDDPGFFAYFVCNEKNKNEWMWFDGMFHPYLSWFFGTEGGEIIIKDEIAYARLARENQEWKSQDT